MELVDGSLKGLGLHRWDSGSLDAWAMPAVTAKSATPPSRRVLLVRQSLAQRSDSAMLGEAEPAQERKLPHQPSISTASEGPCADPRPPSASPSMPSKALAGAEGHKGTDAAGLVSAAAECSCRAEPASSVGQEALVARAGTPQLASLCQVEFTCSVRSCFAPCTCMHIWC